MGNLLEYLPLPLRGVAELASICTAQQQALSALQAEIERALENQFADSADAEGLRRLEAAFALAPSGESSIQERRFALKAQMLEKRPLSLGGIRKALETLCGVGNCTAVMHLEAQTLQVRLALVSKASFGAAVRLIEAAKPATVVLDADLLYNRHGAVGAFTHGALKTRVHLGIRDAVL